MTVESTKMLRLKSVVGSVLGGMIIGFLAAAVLYKAAPDWTPDFLESSPIVFFGFFVIVCGILGWIHAVVPDAPQTSSSSGRHPRLGSLFSGALIGFLASAALYGHLPIWVPAAIRESPWIFFSGMMILCAAAGFAYAKADEIPIES